jgi:hypothetical protein
MMLDAVIKMRLPLSDFPNLVKARTNYSGENPQR